MKYLSYKKPETTFTRTLNKVNGFWHSFYAFVNKPIFEIRNRKVLIRDIFFTSVVVGLMLYSIYGILKTSKTPVVRPVVTPKVIEVAPVPDEQWKYIKYFENSTTYVQPNKQATNVPLKTGEDTHASSSQVAIMHDLRKSLNLTTPTLTTVNNTLPTVEQPVEPLVDPTKDPNLQQAHEQALKQNQQADQNAAQAANNIVNNKTATPEIDKSKVEKSQAAAQAKAQNANSNAQKNFNQLSNEEKVSQIKEQIQQSSKNENSVANQSNTDTFKYTTCGPFLEKEQANLYLSNIKKNTRKGINTSTSMSFDGNLYWLRINSALNANDVSWLQRYYNIKCTGHK
ncbi:hypothetical protein [Psittacicella hinzii]|uniref:SPOR domain-containing protein n=1 Tax=Psittacicella hinzii TaxID=2028575 RepID=A0A3A1YBW0_9GAMM|nr:hypothetical protein [Psittacicella hinzii]RIY34668.1 hypothetical protein CKF58_07920 [Psittacicella hinzii]